MSIQIEILNPKPGMTVEEAADYVNGAATPQERQARKREVYSMVYSPPVPLPLQFERLPPDDSEGGNP